MNETRALADFVAATEYKDLDAKTIDNAKMCISDALGVSFPGSQTRPSRILSEVLLEDSHEGSAVICEPGFRRTDAKTAAAVNAAAIHSQDFDDLHNSSIVHAGAITIPTAVALGQELKKSPKDVLLAIVMGYETAARCGESINPSSYYFWHTTAVVGALASAATASKLLGLDAEQTAQAFGSAGTQAAGLWAFLKEGSMSKLLHVANANICGIRSAKLAQKGFTGATDIIESPKGFAAALSEDPKPEFLTKDLGADFKINSNSFKPYACCRHTHSACYGIYSIKEKYGIKPEDIECIEDYTYKTALTITDNDHPTNPYAAKFSLQYCIAAALLFDNLSDMSFTEEKLGNPDILNLISKTKLYVSDEIDETYRKDSNQWGHRLKITMRDGTVIDEFYRYPFGDFNNPFDWSDAENKFMMLSAPVIGKDKAVRLFNNIRKFETLSDTDELFVL